jgi:hypothetical protein
MAESSKVGLGRRLPPTSLSSAGGFHRVGQRPLREIFLSRPHPLKITDDPGGIVPTIEKILNSKSKIINSPHPAHHRVEQSSLRDRTPPHAIYPTLPDSKQHAIFPS